MNIKLIKVGFLKCNCYLIERNNECLLIDPGDEYSKIKDLIEGKNLLSILITHNHFDHVGCVRKLKKEFSVQVYRSNNLKEGHYQIGPFEFDVIRTKGHSKDSITYYFKEEKIMFTGDFLFKGTIGRCDLPGGSKKEMKISIEIIKQYEDDITIYPGHGRITTLGKEKQENPYFI